MKKKQLISFLCLIILFCGCQKKEKTIKVAATAVPHAEMLERIVPELEARGYKLQVIVVDDYNLPNRLLSEKQIDANFFQHEPFLREQVKEFGYPLVVLTRVHIEPIGIYSSKIDTLNDLKDKAIVGIPSDPTNESRALFLLQDKGLITLKEKKEESKNLLTPLDIIDNPKKLQIREIDGALLPRSLKDVDIAIIPSNFALQANLSPTTDALARESINSPYVNVLVTRAGYENNPGLVALSELLTSNEMRAYIERRYRGAILPVF